MVPMATRAWRKATPSVPPAPVPTWMGCLDVHLRVQHVHVDVRMPKATLATSWNVALVQHASRRHTRPTSDPRRTEGMHAEERSGKTGRSSTGRGGRSGGTGSYGVRRSVHTGEGGRRGGGKFLDGRWRKGTRLAKGWEPSQSQVERKGWGFGNTQGRQRERIDVHWDKDRTNRTQCRDVSGAWGTRGTGRNHAHRSRRQRGASGSRDENSSSDDPPSFLATRSIPSPWDMCRRGIQPNEILDAQRNGFFLLLDFPDPRSNRSHPDPSFQLSLPSSQASQPRSLRSNRRTALQGLGATSIEEESPPASLQGRRNICRKERGGRNARSTLADVWTTHGRHDRYVKLVWWNRNGGPE